MIAFLRGQVFRTRDGILELDVQGVGYSVFVTDRLLFEVNQGDSIFIYTHYHVREDAAQLFGFKTDEEREWFELLLNVTGIGPKGAIQIVSASEPSAFYFAVATEDVGALCKLPGIGKKTAGRLVVELKDKIQHHATASSVQKASHGEQTATSVMQGSLFEVVEALKMLGYNEKQALEQATTLFKEDENMSVETALKRCLQNLDTSQTSRRRLV